MKYQTKQFCFKRNQKGFTLVELFVTLAIATIILTQAVPGFVNLIRDNKLISQTNDLVADINLARSEAVARGVRVFLCTSADSRAAGAKCDGTAGTWSTGWLMFADDDGTPGITATTDTLIRIGQPAKTSVTVMANTAGSTDLQFNSDGTTNEGVNTVVFAVCYDSDVTTGRQISISTTGRPRLIPPTIGSCTP